jgi:hypothetical protein
MSTTVNELREMLGLPPLTEAPTGLAMTMPSPVSIEIATNVADNFDIETVVRDLGAIVAREFANELQRMALRPADYATIPDLTNILAIRVASYLMQLPDVFDLAFLQALRNRG